MEQISDYKWKTLNETPIPHRMFQGPGVMAEKGAKKVVSLRDKGKI